MKNVGTGERKKGIWTLRAELEDPESGFTFKSVSRSSSLEDLLLDLEERLEGFEMLVRKWNETN